jgi:KDO2-lipid IV(A) lauroyltransferase
LKAGFVDRVVHLAARAAIGLAARVPETLGYGLAGALGRCFFVLDRRRRGYALKFLRNAYPAASEAELRRIGARATANLFKVPLDMARLTRLLASGGSVRDVVDFGEATATLATAKPPFLGLTGHLGSWEVAAVAMAQAFGRAHGIARVSRNPLLQRWILANRERGGLVIHPRRGGVRGLARALAAGEVGLQAVDQNQRLRGVFVPFFGQLASCERAAVSLALRFGYPVVFGTALRVGRGFRFRFVLRGPVQLDTTGDRAADLRAGVLRVNQEIEQLVRLAPEQYLWIHDRYRTQPKPGATAAVAEAGLGHDDDDDAGD